MRSPTDTRGATAPAARGEAAEATERAAPPLLASRSRESSTGTRDSLATEPIEAEPGIVLEGRVLELAAGAERASGIPAAGVTVWGAQGLRGLGADAGSAPSATTGADGGFRLVLADDGKRPRALELVVEGDERFLHASLKLRLEPGESRRVGLVLARHAHGDLTGRTIDLRGEPIAGVEVALLGWDESGSSLVPQQTARSDENGAFRLECVNDVNELEAQKSGYALLHANRPVQGADGRFEPLELVLCAQAALRIVVVDPAGEPVPDVHVSVAVAAPERFGASRSRMDGLRQNRRAATDATGTALLPVIWADQHVRVSLDIAREGEGITGLGAFERVSNGRPVFEPEEGGVPLFVEPSSERTLHVELAGRYRIRGRVVEEDGSAFREPWVSVRTIDRPRSAPGSLEQTRRGDERGVFELELLSHRPLGQLLVTATDTGPRTLNPTSIPTKSASVVIELSARPGGVDDLELVMSATRAIAGRIVCEPPEVRAAIRAYPRAGGLPYGDLVNGTSRYAMSSKGGFRLPGLPAGRYDLEVMPSSRYPVVWVPDVEAGTEGLTVVLEGSRPARVTVEVAPSEGELDETILLRGRLRPDGVAPDAPELPVRATRSDPEGWPPDMLQLWYGGGGRIDEVGWTAYELVPMRENPTTLELDEGLYWLGVKARAQDGNYTFPIGTGLVRVGAGEHHLRFELGPGASVEGRVTGVAPGSELCAALARAGELLVLDVRREKMSATCELGHDGWFRFPLVPVGALELRVGTRAELLAGRWLRREELRAERGAIVSVEVEL